MNSAISAQSLVDNSPHFKASHVIWQNGQPGLRCGSGPRPPRRGEGQRLGAGGRRLPRSSPTQPRGSGCWGRAASQRQQIYHTLPLNIHAPALPSRLPDKTHLPCPGQTAPQSVLQPLSSPSSPSHPTVIFHLILDLKDCPFLTQNTAGQYTSLMAGKQGHQWKLQKIKLNRCQEAHQAL